ncbi:MAG: hypothetical protein V4584_08355 [Verrucomicrobiota bacterium]
MLKFAQSVLFTLFIVCLALTTALTLRDTANRRTVNTAIEKLRQLKEDKSISSSGFHDITDQLNPLLHPSSHDPWLLRNLSPIGSVCMIVMCLLSFAGPSIMERKPRPARLIKSFKSEHPDES